jgi:hypothetical protein
LVDILPKPKNCSPAKPWKSLEANPFGTKDVKEEVPRKGWEFMGWFSMLLLSWCSINWRVAHPFLISEWGRRWDSGIGITFMCCCFTCFTII